MYITNQTLGLVSLFVFLFNIFIQQGCIKLKTYDNKNVYNQKCMY